ncbi:DUF4412 domain-containing protein [Bryobacter aggregatus]|uniref:DUF4412 domain-containing protein n=1 Tax=Bryobacter aggregatus TaxID=360054 RepID=UPI0004E1AC93|nr:DUF4412 domain-containing protein [Bryobacter aggregatus]
MKKIAIASLALSLCSVAYADFRYLSTIKSGPGSGNVTKHLIKGNKMKLDAGSIITITDLDAQTTTTIRPAEKTYRVVPLSQAAATLEKTGTDIKVDVKETGQKKKIGAYDCRQVILNMTLTGQVPMNMEMEMWVSSEIPGANELKAIGMKIAERSAAASGNANMQKAMLEVQRQSAKINGVPVLTILRMKSGDDEKSKQMQAQMQAARAQLEAMKKQGGAGAAALEKALAGMGPAGSKYLMEMTTESSEFSTAAVAASEFAVPVGFTKVDK